MPSRDNFIKKVINDCPLKCFYNNDEFIKYRAKNPYSTTLQFENDYYEVTAIIMNQLVSSLVNYY